MFCALRTKAFVKIERIFLDISYLYKEHDNLMSSLETNFAFRIFFVNHKYTCFYCYISSMRYKFYLIRRFHHLQFKLDFMSNAMTFFKLPSQILILGNDNKTGKIKLWQKPVTIIVIICLICLGLYVYGDNILDCRCFVLRS